MTIIAVSGASGFLGTHLCPELISRGHRVVVIPRAVLGAADLHLRLEGVEVIVHLAARAHVLREPSKDPRAEFWRVNVGSTQAAARAAKAAGVKRFIFLSSAGVLGSRSPPAGFHDASIPCPHNAYTASKLAAETCLEAEIGDAMQLVTIRPPLIYGPGAKGNFLRILRLARSGWPLPIGSFRAPRSMIGIRNMVNLIGHVAVDQRVSRSTMLAADRETISVADLYLTISRFAGHRPWLAPLSPATLRWLLSLSGRSGDIARLTEPFVLCPTRARSQFGWTPPYTLDDELRRTVFSELNNNQ